jgi:hypothetical protein
VSEIVAESPRAVDWPAMMAEIGRRNEEAGVRQKGGKKYTMVQDRVEVVRRCLGDRVSIETEVIKDEGDIVQVKATIAVPDGDGYWVVIATGHAEEIRGASKVNETSALENCETSAIGRALASAGLHGGEFASANEIDRAVAKGELLKQTGDDFLGGSPPPKPEMGNPPPGANLAPVGPQTANDGGELPDLKQPSELRNSYGKGDPSPDDWAKIGEVCVGIVEHFVTDIPALVEFARCNTDLLKDMEKAAKSQFDKVMLLLKAKKAKFQKGDK